MIRAEEQESGVIKLWNHIFRDPSSFASATFNAERDGRLSKVILSCLDQCHYQVVEQDNGYHGAMEPGCRCIVHRNGKDTVLVSHVSSLGR